MGAGPGAGPRRGGAGDLAEEKAGLGGGGRDRAEEGGAWPRGQGRGRAEKGAGRVEEGAGLGHSSVKSFCLACARPRAGSLALQKYN